MVLSTSKIQINWCAFDMRDLTLVKALTDLPCNCGDHHSLIATGSVPIDQCFCAWIFGLAEQILWLGVLDNLAIGHHKDAVRDFTRKPHLMRNNEHGHAILGDFLHHVE